jgi:hypothetical protein
VKIGENRRSLVKPLKRELKLKHDISTRDFNSTSALCCKRILTVLAYPLRAASVSGVPRSDIASTSTPLERRNFTISDCPGEKEGKQKINLLIVHGKTFLARNIE